jgi:hypothetical protein
MGWNNDKTAQHIVIDNFTYDLHAVAEKRGFKILICNPAKEGIIPDYNTRKKIETKVTRLFQEHLIIFIDAKKREQIWQLVVRQTGKPAKITETRYHISQDPELLFQRAAGIFFEMDEEDNITIVDVTKRVAENFHQNNEKVTKQFYESFKKQHTSFLSFIKGIDAKADKDWYASVMLNRLMFCYFIQKKGFLDKNKNYLRHKLDLCKEKKGKDKFYSFYRSFLLVLFHEGLNEPAQKEKIKIEIGKIPYLNGGLFDEHELEKNHEIDIDDKAFERIFDFFDQYEWHLDTRIEATGKDINPDVIGYIFEKYINDRAQMGAYYTKEDITDYISKNCIIPWLFDETARHYAKAFADHGDIWTSLKESGDEYIYDTVRHGTVEPLPKEIQAGIKDVSRRTEWNKLAPPNLALPTEIWREVVERRHRYDEMKKKITGGEITAINDFITCNLNIRQFTQDIIENSHDADFIRTFYKALNSVTIIDPTCGSGAFLFAAMNILEPLYHACIMRMRAFTEDEDRENEQEKKTFKNKYKYFREVLENIQSEQHPNLQYFIYKSIILNNLYGVDIMREAVEIAKLRLFLKLVATVEADYRKKNLGLEPLPDIDFNIRTGNTLIGFSTIKELKTGSLDFQDDEKKVLEELENVSMAFKRFKEIQLASSSIDYKDFKIAKAGYQKQLNKLKEKLNLSYFNAFGNQKTKFTQWLDTHQPFHWFAEFYEIIYRNGGFEVIIGNPPYIDFKMGFSYTIDNRFSTAATKNLYAVVLERCGKIAKSKQGYIVPISSTSTEGFVTLQKLLLKNELFVSTFDDRPSHLFDGLNKNTLSILLLNNDNTGKYFTTDFIKWNSAERDFIFEKLGYEEGVKVTLPGCLPKIGNSKSASIWNKLFKISKPLSLFYSKNGNHKSFYSRKINSFLQSLDFTPKVFDGKGKLRPPSEFKELKFNSSTQSKVAYCLLNSNLFRWFVDITSDGSHLNKREIDSFPIDLTEKAFNWSPIEKISKDLSTSLLDNSEYRTMKYTHDTLKIQCIIPKLSKSIIDKIDKVLASHYSLTDEEVDFLVNYDIKYRLGKDLESDDEE